MKTYLPFFIYITLRSGWRLIYLSIKTLTIELLFCTDMK